MNNRYFHVNLHQSRLDKLNQKVEKNTNFLKDKLDGYRKYSTQGSFTHSTIIKSADILVSIKDDNFNPHRYDADYVKKSARCV